MAMSVDIYYRAKLLLLLVFFPLSIAVYGGWQHYRSLDTIDTYTLQLKRDRDYLKHILDTGRKPTIRLNNGQPISPSAMLRRVEIEISVITTAQFCLTHITYIPCVAGLAAALMGGRGILSVQRAGRRALQSRQALLESFQKGLEYLPWLVGAFGLLIALGLCALLLYELSNYAFLYLDDSNNGTRLLIMGAIGCGALLLFGLSLVKNMFKAAHASVKSTPRFLLGTHVSEAEAPKVWAFVHVVAEKARTPREHGLLQQLDIAPN